MTRWRDALIDATDYSIAVIDRQGCIIAVNHSWRHFCLENGGEEAATSPGANYLAVCDASAGGGSEDARAMASGLRALLNGESQSFSLDYECHAPTEKRWFRAVARYVADTDAVLIEHRTTTELTLSRRAERMAQARFETLLHDVQVGVIMQNQEGRITAANDVAAELFGTSVESMRGRRCEEWVLLDEDGTALSTEDHPVHRAIDSKRACRNRLVGFDGPNRGGRTWCVLHAVPHLDDDGQVIEVVCSLTDITARRSMEEALTQREESLRETGRLARVGGWALDLRSNELSWNEETCRIHEVPVDYQPSLEDAIAFYAPEARQAITEAVQEGVASGKPWDLELPFVTAKGKERWVRALGRAELHQGRAVRLFGAFQDVTERVESEKERRELESHLQQAQKLESLGMLAGGIAHDFNNLLTTILGNAELAALELPAGSSARKSLEIISTTSQRASDLCNQMLAYSGRGRFLLESVCLSRLVEDMREMLRLAVSKKARIEWRLEPDVPAILADATQVRQVVMNLVLNASEARGEDPVAIVLSTGHEDGFAFVAVDDDGTGMDDDTRARMFEPFFTTKFQGRGLGMAAVQGIVNSHKGRIDVESAPGQGSRVRVFLPISAEKSSPTRLRNTSPARSPTFEPTRTGASWKPNGRILLVDDEEDVREVAAALLSEIGFDVETASDGREALVLLDGDPARFDALVLDLTMPVMDGDVTLREIRKRNHAIPVLVASGYSEQEFDSRFQMDDRVRFVQKPFGLSQLRDCLEALTSS